MDGALKDRNTYEIMDPDSVGWKQGEVTLQSHMGKNGIVHYLNKLGYDGEVLYLEVGPLFLELADRKPSVTLDDLHMLAQEVTIKQEIHQESLFDIREINYKKGKGEVILQKNGDVHGAEGSGEGAVDGLCNAICSCVESFGVSMEDVRLINYQVIKGDGGPEAIAWVVVSLSCGDVQVHSRAADPDTVIASAKAYLYAVNNLLTRRIS